MHPQLQQHLLNVGLDFDTPPPDKETWQAFLRLLNTEFFAHHNEDKAKPMMAVPALDEPRQFDHRVIAERDKLKAVLAALDKGVCVFDIQGRLILLNAAAKRYLGNVQPLTGENVLRYFKVHDQWSADMMEAPLLLQLIREGSNLRDSDAMLLRDDGSELPVSFVLNPLINKRHVIGSVLVFEDICEHKQVEAALLAAKEAAEKASTAKSEFMTSMSHELRTPMNAILGYGDIILDELGDAPEECDPNMIEELETSIQNILQAGRTLLGLINDVLDLSRLESGKLDIQVEKLDLSKLVAERLKLQEEAIAARGLSVESPPPGTEPAFVLADPRHLAQVVDSLLSNAIKYNKPDGTVRVSLDTPPAHVRLYVEDTGIGMNAEQQTQIFQPFVRMSGRNLSVGTGVGLTLCKHLVEIMGGHIGLESRLDQGTTFWVEFPMGQADAKGILTTGAHRRFLMLYIEDSRTNVSLVTKILKSRPDVGLVSAPNGEMGIELARSHSPDLILLDINLPGIDGFEVLKRIQGVEHLGHIPVIGLSADDTQAALRQAEAAGFYHYMIKPLDKEQFLKAVDTILHIQQKTQE